MSLRSLWMGVVIALCSVSMASAVASAEPLPEGRVYELVTPPDNIFGSEAYLPGAEPEVSVQFYGDQTLLPFQASSSGERIAFVAGLTEGGSEASGYNSGNEYLGTRTPGGGWTQTNITPANATSAVYQGFSSDLSVGYLDSLEPLSSTAPGFSEPAGQFGGNYDVLYSTLTSGDQYTPAFTVKPPYRSQLSFKTAPPILSANVGGKRGYNGRVLAFAGASFDSAHVLFLANDALTQASEGRPAAEGGASASFEAENNLYESVEGSLRLVNVLPDGSTHAGATFGGGAPFERVISADGSRVFWTDTNTGHIYVRENGTRTTEISASGNYQTATVDGSRVFYTDGDLYVYELAGATTTDLTPGVPVSRVVGTSEGGEYVYFVTTAGELEVWHEGATVPITALSVNLSEVTPDGHGIVFGSGTGELKTVRVYDADNGSLYCASCTAAGSYGALHRTNEANVYQPRWISRDGTRVFFESKAALVPQDTNGLNDVYEWQRPGSGGCEKNEGCVHLLSGGTSNWQSAFVDAGESGNDVFFVTLAKLVPADDNGLYDLYDARVGGDEPASAPVCTGTGCQGIPEAPPIFATPSSVTFEGVGNFSSSSAKATQPKPKKKPMVKKKVKRRNGRHGKSQGKARKAAQKSNGQRRSQKKGKR